MFTQCIKCDAVFKLSAEALRTTAGNLRCEKCGEIFNALTRLAEDTNSFAIIESPLDLETRAASILESTGAVEVIQAAYENDEEFAPSGVEIAQLQVLDWPEEDLAADDSIDTPNIHAANDDRSMEFTLPPGELDKVFVQFKKSAPPPQSESLPENAANDAIAPQLQPESAPITIPKTDQPTSGFEVSDEVRREVLAAFEQNELPANVLQSLRRSSHGPLIAWLGACILLVLLLAAQIVHQHREWLIAHSIEPFRGVLYGLYGALGNPLPSPASLSTYQLRQWGVTGDPDTSGTLQVRASILNSAAQLQPYPLLRVTLADRFGKYIGRREFEPSEYLGKATAKLLAPGERTDITLAILDPGKNAEGFEIEVCLRGIDRRISCANDAATRTQP